MIDDTLQSITALTTPQCVAIWCVDRPDAVRLLLDHPTLGPLLSDGATAPLFDPLSGRIPVREWASREMAMDGKPRWMNWMPPGVYVEMSTGLPMILKVPA